MNEWKTGAKLADDKPERWPHGWTHRSDAPTVIERWEKGRVEVGERVGKRGKQTKMDQKEFSAGTQPKDTECFES